MDLLEQLCRAPGVSGFEQEVREIMKKELEDSCEWVEEDSFGNIVASKGQGEKKIMLAAHMDEVGFMVKHINEEGFINFVKIGGMDNRLLLNQRVVVKSKDKDYKGIIGSKPPHLQKKEEKKKVIKHDKMFIDIGAKDKEQAQEMVSVGDPIVFEDNFGHLNENMYYGKAVDNRLGCYIMLKVMQQLPDDFPAQVLAVGTAQEEVGLKGARVSAFKLEPDYAFAIDTTIAGDTPQIQENESSLETGQGPAITITEASGRGVVTHPKLRELLVEVAKDSEIPYQVDVLEGGMTDAAIIYMTRAGVPTGVISLPCRYIHSSTGVFDKKDADHSTNLMVKALTKLKDEDV